MASTPWNGKALLRIAYGKHADAVWYLCRNRATHGLKVDEDELGDFVSVALMWRYTMGDLDDRKAAYVVTCVEHAIDEWRRSRGLDTYARPRVNGHREFRKVTISSADPQSSNADDDGGDLTVFDQNVAPDPTSDAAIELITGTEDPAAWLAELVQGKIAELPDAERTAYWLHVNAGYGPTAIARELNVSPDTAKRKLQKAMDALRPDMEAHVRIPERTPRVAPEGAIDCGPRLRVTYQNESYEDRQKFIDNGGDPNHLPPPKRVKASDDPANDIDNAPGGRLPRTKPD
jgi:DNA-directed RNA polymerase specialized sigma24 family protein